ncbi:hypothetical protein [Pontibacter flavimaris]|nr:hypothetical protein [Pontibacter flavimaris]
MEEIKALVRITADDNNVNLLFPQANKNNKEGMLYQNLLTDVYSDDAIASKDLYNSHPNDVKYKMLKHRLKKKLYNNLFFFDYSKQKLKKAHQKEQECIHLLHHAHLLLRLYERDIALNLTSKVKSIAKDYEYINYLIDALELEMTNFSDKGDLTKYNSAREELEYYLYIKKYEREAITLFQLLRIQLKKSVKSRRGNLLTFEEDLVRLKLLWQKTKSYETFNAYYKANIIYHEMTGDFSSIVDLTVHSEELLQAGQVNKIRFDADFNKYILVYAHLRAKKLERGLKYAAEFLYAFEEDNPNWFAYMENYFLLALYTRNYLLVETLLHKVFNNPSFKKQQGAAKERWTLYQAYFLLLNSTVANFNNSINPFLLSLPEYSKDKQGFNVAILILQFIHYLQKKDTEALLYRIESLKKYILTHLKETFSLRSKTFLKLLILTVTEDYDAKSSRTKGQKLYQKLVEAPTPGDAFAEIEIVPYEHLWDHILFILENKYQ